MKILVFTTLFPNSKMPNHGLFVKERIVNLAKLCEVIVVAPVPYFPKLKINEKWHKFSQIPMEEGVEGLRVYHPRYFITPKIFRSLYGFFMYLSVRGFMKRLKNKYNYDLIDGHFVYPDGLAAVLLAREAGVKVALTARGSDINWYPKFRLIRKLIQYALNKSDVVVSVNEDLKDKMIGLGVPREKIEVVANGVDLNKFYPVPRNKAREDLVLPFDDKIILSIGNLVESKGFDILIKAVSRIRRSDISLYIIGDGPYRKELEEIANRLEIRGRVRFLGELPQAELCKWYSAADIFCLTSRREGRPNVILESMACGTPVISMNKWGLSELIRQGTGLLLESYDPSIIAVTIEDALNSKWDKEKIVASVRHLDWQKTANSLTAIFSKVLAREDILFFSSDDWASGLKTSKYHLATRLARTSRVFFINSIGLRTPSASKSDAKKIIAKLAAFFRGVKAAQKNLFVYTPIVIPFQGAVWVRSFNNVLIRFQMRIIMGKFDVRNPIIWTFLPNSSGPIKGLRRKKLIYYCVDDMSAFKGVPAEAIRKLDDELTRKADVVFTVSRALYDKKIGLNANTFYSPHGVDFELFNKAMTNKGLAMPEDMRNIPAPIIGFYGLISSDWIDYGLVRFLAKARPEWSFVFIGKIDALVEEPPKAKNIFYLPVKKYDELYKYSRYFDVAMLPFNVNTLTSHSNPLKILEYLSAGKPVVSINIPEMLKYENVIEIAADYEEFLIKIEKCLKNDSGEMVDKRVLVASQNSWEKRFDEINKIIGCHS